MARFIEATNLEGEKVLLNLDVVCEFYPCATGTGVRFVGGLVGEICEGFETIESLCVAVEGD